MKRPFIKVNSNAAAASHPHTIDVAALLDRFPLEVVARCFIALPFRDRLSVSHVCRKWRRVALGIPRLWSSLEFHHYARDGAVFTEMLARSASAPLDAVWIWDIFRKDGLRQLVAHMPRVRSIDVGVRHDHQGRLYHAVTYDAFPVMRAPQLERVRFASESCFTMRPAWSGDGAPRLREMLLQRFKLDPACQQFRALRRFRGHLVCLPPGTYQDLRGFVSLCPVLEDLELLGATDAYLPWLPIGASRALKSYILSNARGTIDYMRMCQWEGPIPRHMRLSHAVDFSLVFAFYMDQMTQTSSISCISTASQNSVHDLPEFAIALTCTTGARLEFDTLDQAAYIVGLRDALPRLTLLMHLECSVEIFDTLLRDSPVLPALERLTLIPGGQRKFADLNYCHFQKLGTLHVPALRVLEVETMRLALVPTNLEWTALTWCTRTLPRTMDAWLRFSREKLEAVHMLVLEHSSYTLDALDVAALLQRTEQVQLLRRSAMSLDEATAQPDP